MDAGAVASNAILSDISVSAFADPSIYIDPTFALANEFSVVVSDGVPNPAPSPVPEPSSFILLMTGVLGLLNASRRLRRS
jgi:hypothetical protein